MGVNGLQQIIDTFGDTSIKQIPYKNFRGTVQSLDTSIVLYKFCIAMLHTESLNSSEGIFVGHLFAALYKSLAMLKYGIMPLWVFDGNPPMIKDKTLAKRKSSRVYAQSKITNEQTCNVERLTKRAFNIKSTQIRQVKHLLNLLGLPKVEAPGEAEAQCAANNIANISNAVVTEDWDVIMFGCKSMLKEFSNKSNVIQIDINQLLKNLEMNRLQLIDLSCILGNDYCDGISGIKALDAYMLFKNCKFNMVEFLGIVEKEKKYTIPDNFLENLELAKDYYLNAPVVNPKNISLIWKEPKYDEIKKFLVDDMKIDVNIINPKLEEFQILYERYRINNVLITMSRIKKEQEEIKMLYDKFSKDTNNKKKNYVPNYVYCKSNKELSILQQLIRQKSILKKIE